MDFDDLLVYTARLLEDNPACAINTPSASATCWWMNSRIPTWRNTLLVKHLASVHKNMFCVGDPDQSVYRWRGADWRNVQRFEQDFPMHR